MTVVSNPFCTRYVRPGAIPFFFEHDQPDVATNRITTQLIQRQFGLIIGPHGSGKTTLLHALCQQLDQRFDHVVRLRLSAGPTSRLLGRIRHRRQATAIIARHQSRLPSHGLLIVDGLEQMSWTSRAQLLARARRQHHFLLATSHSPLLGFSTLFETRITSPLIRSLTESVICRGDANVRRLIEDELGRRDLTELSNMRDLWFEFYDLVAAIDPQKSQRDRDSTPLISNT